MLCTTFVVLSHCEEGGGGLSPFISLRFNKMGKMIQITNIQLDYVIDAKYWVLRE